MKVQRGKSPPRAKGVCLSASPRSHTSVFLMSLPNVVTEPGKPVVLLIN